MTGVINDIVLEGSPPLMEDTVTKSSSETAVSKRSIKRKAKREKWEKTKMEKRRQERKKLKEKKKLAKAFPGSVENLRSTGLRKKLKQTTMEGSSCKQRVCIDLSLDSYMSEKDCAKCMKQIMRCYSLNRRAANPLQFYVTSLIGRPKEVLDKNKGCEFWDVNYREEDYLSIFNNSDIVYLSSESENIIKDLDDTKVYVIGGLVDHNLHKGLTHRLAVEAGIAHAKLPLDEFIDMKTRKVLTIDQVYDILRRLANGEHWGEAIVAALPSRKGAFVKDEES